RGRIPSPAMFWNLQVVWVQSVGMEWPEHQCRVVEDSRSQFRSTTETSSIGCANRKWLAATRVGVNNRQRHSANSLNRFPFGCPPRGAETVFLVMLKLHSLAVSWRGMFGALLLLVSMV